MAITDPAGSVLGEIRAENLRTWNFNVQDANGPAHRPGRQAGRGHRFIYEAEGRRPLFPDASGQSIQSL